MFSLFKKLIFKKDHEIFLVDSDKDIDFLKYNLLDENFLGIDTEFDWRNTYIPKLSLLQIATSKTIFLVDCIKCSDLSFLKNILENKKKLLIFHSSRSDATVLNSNLKIKIKNVFDIQIAEKIISGGEIKNYGSIVKKYFSVHLDKSETNSNWLRRPFSEDQLSYAAEDVSFLIDIYKKQIKVLKKLGLLIKTIDESKKEASYGNEEFYISRLKKLKKPSEIEKKVFLWRENYAKKKNIPPSYIFSNKNFKMLSKEIKNKSPSRDLSLNIFKKKSYLDDFYRDLDL